MDYVLAPFIWLIGLIFSILLWIVTQLFWLVLWFVLPILVIAFVALRIAERVLGQEKVRAWVRARTQKYGSAASKRAQRWVFALGVAPVRVLFWFVLYTIWHSVVSLMWRPRWSPWQRAWGKRWRQPPQLQGRP
jgi:hypothetical protein